jgi:hypothetical protein
MKTELLPEVLRQFQPRLEEALATPMLITWDGEETFAIAEQPAAVVRALVKAIHVHLVNAKIGVVFRKQIKKRDRTVLAQASKCGGKLEFFSKLDLLIEVNWEAWFLLQPEKKLALIDHELCHFSKDTTEKGETRYMLLSHDVEEFSGIVKRWGLWKNDLKQFANVLRSSGQLDAFTPEEPETVKADAKPEAPKSTRQPRGKVAGTISAAPAAPALQ